VQRVHNNVIFDTQFTEQLQWLADVTIVMAID